MINHAMPKIHSRSLPALALLAFAGGFAGCSEEPELAPGAISEGEAQALEEAAEMLDEQRVPVEAIAPPATESSAEDTSAKESEAADLTDN